MPENIPSDTNTPPAPAAGAPPPAADPAVSAAGNTNPPPPAAAPAGQSGVQVVPHAAFKRIKEEEFAKGKNAAMEELARASGFESVTEFVSAMQKSKTPSPGAQAPVAATPPAPMDDASATPEDVKALKDDKRQSAMFQRQLEKAINDRNRYAQTATDWRKKAEDARSEADAVRAEMHLRTIAASVGVQDIDYAITLFSREVEKLTPEQAEKFDERAYFNALRKSKPLLFGEAVQPATTGTGTGGAPTPPAPGQVAAAAAANGKVDAKKLNPQQFQELIKSRGINPHGV